jgi:hypothetical protein
MSGIATEIQGGVKANQPVTFNRVAGFLFAGPGKSTRLPGTGAETYASPWNHRVHSQTKTTTGENYEQQIV